MLETAAKEEMSIMDRAAQEADLLLVQGERHMKDKMEISLSVQKHRELAELAEVATHERIRKLQMRRIREDVRVDWRLPWLPQYYSSVIWDNFVAFRYWCVLGGAGGAGVGWGCCGWIVIEKDIYPFSSFDCVYLLLGISLLLGTVCCV